MATSLPVSGGQDDEIISLEKVLTEHHLSDIVSATYGARAKWRAIGLALRLTSSTLDVIALETHTVDDKYEQVLIRWIRKGAVTRDLVAALERNTVNENRLASELILKYERRTLSINEDATPDVKIVIQEIRILKREFSQIVNKVKQVAVEKKWTNDTVVSLLTIEFPLRYTSSHPIVFVKKNMQEITNAESIKELWGHLCLHWNIMNTDLLEYIIDELENYNLTTEMNAFVTKVALFRSKTAIKVFMKAETIEPLMEDIEQNLEILVTSHIHSALSGNSTLEDADVFRKKFAKMYMLHEVALCICKISPGSIQIQWSIPESIVSSLMSDLRRCPDRLDALGLRFVTIDLMTVYAQDKDINKDDFPGVIAILRPITNKWKDIGLALKIEKQVLDDFENNPELAKGGPEGLLIETLNTVEILTVKTLVHVLRSPSVQEEDIAQAVEEHFLTTRGKVNVEIAMLAQSFESLKTSASQKLEFENLKTKQIHKYLIRLYPDNAIPKPVAVELESAHSSLDYFSILTRYGMWSYINHHLLKMIIEEMVPRDNELRKQIVQYRDEVDIFACNTAIHDYIDLHQMKAVEAVANVMPVDLHAPYPEMFTFFQMKFELSFANKSLKHILTIQQQLMKHFSLPHPTLLLGEVSRGSVAINWYFPQVETERICSVANSSEYFFREFNVIQVNIDDNFKLRIDQTAERQEVRSSDNELQVRVIFGEFPGEKAPGVHHLEALSELEQRLFYTRVLCTNFSFLYEHLNTPAILAALGERELIDLEGVEDTKIYSGKHAQNTLAIHEMQLIKAPPNCIEKLCEILNQDHVARTLYSEYEELAKHGYPQPSLTISSSAECFTFSDLSSAFLQMLSDVIDAFDKSPNSLGVLKRLLNQLVLPVGSGKVAPLVDPAIYKDTELIRQLFRLLSPLLNCLSPDLIRYLCEQSSCSLAINAVKEFIRVHDQHAESILCIRQDDESELNELDTASSFAPLSPGHFKAHSMPLDKLQSLHPLVFRRLDIHKSTSSPQMVRLSVEVNRPMLTLQDYDNITNAVSAVLMLPRLAMVYAGCTVAPLVLTWLVPSQLKETNVSRSTASGDRLLAEQCVVSIAVGENLKMKTLGIQEARLRETALYGLVEWIPQLVEQGVDIDAGDVREGHTALYFASHNGHTDVVKCLLTYGAKVDQITEENQATPLTISSVSGHSEIVRVLLEAGANIDHQNKNGQTAVYCASAYGHSEVVKLLVQAGADLELQHKESQDTPLGISSGRGHSEVVRVLLEAGANVNHQAINQVTPLMEAAREGHTAVVKELLTRQNLNINMTDKDGDTAVDWALMKGHSEIIQLILSKL